MNTQPLAPHLCHLPWAPIASVLVTGATLLLASKIAALATIISIFSLVIFHRIAHRESGEIMLANYIWSFIVECGSVVFAALSCLTPPASLFNPKELDPDQPLIVLDNGYAHNSTGLHYLRYKLKAAGFKNVVCINLSGIIFNPFRSIENFSDNLKEKIAELDPPPGMKIIIAAHSTGGVAALKYAVDHNPQVAKIITIASPVLGTKMAKYAVGECTRQMRAGSEFITKLNEEIAKTDFPIVNIGGSVDMVIQPTQNAFISNRANTTHYRSPYHGHLTLLYSHYTADIVVQECQVVINPVI